MEKYINVLLQINIVNCVLKHKSYKYALATVTRNGCVSFSTGAVQILIMATSCLKRIDGFQPYIAYLHWPNIQDQVCVCTWMWRSDVWTLYRIWQLSYRVQSTIFLQHRFFPNNPVKCSTIKVISHKWTV